uniref:RING-type E3 ubiquitin transferase n=1 Tax=Jaculus jaculus TaxID=51337 RepID=A0A8C5KF59_JACJA
MLHEAKDRQKFVNDIQYLRDMQHKVDSEYQACLRRQEYKRDTSEKKQDQLWGQELSDRFQLSIASSKQSSIEEDVLSEPRSSIKTPEVKSDSRLPAIDQTSVKQKHKSTMTPKIAEKATPSKPSPEVHEPTVLSKKRKPKPGRLTVGPETHSLRVPKEKSRQNSQRQLTTNTSGSLLYPVAQQEDLMYAGEIKLKRPTRERRNASDSPSQLMRAAGKLPERARKRDPSACSRYKPHAPPGQAAPGPQVPRESLGPAPLPTSMERPRRVPFRFRDEDFYSALSLNPGSENYDTEEETHIEEERLMVGMHSPRSPSDHKRSRFLGTSATLAKNKTLDKNAENCGGNSSRRSESNHGSLRTSNAVGPVTKRPSAGQRILQDPRLPGMGERSEESDGRDRETKRKTRHSEEAKSEPRSEKDFNAEDASGDCASMEDGPSDHDYDREWQNYLSGSRNSFDHILSRRPTAPRSINSSHTTPGSFVHSAMADGGPAGLPMVSVSAPSSDSEENSRFNARRPLSPIRSRNSFASDGNHSSFPAHGAQEADTTSHGRSQGAPLNAEGLLPNPQGSLALNSSSSSPRRNLPGHLYVPGSLQESIPFTVFAVAGFPNQNDSDISRTVSGSVNEKGATKIKADPEKLKKLQESLLKEEDSEEEGDLCRICQIAGGSPTNPLLEPCGCVGSLRFVHQECLKKWLEVKITSGADLGTVKTCEMCKQGLLVNVDDFNMMEFYQKHWQSWARSELMNSGLYLVLLLHLYEQRFAELVTLNYRRASRERLSRNYPQPRPEENESSESGDSNGSGVHPSRVV